MEKDKVLRKMKKLKVDLPKIQNRTLNNRNSQKQNVKTAMNIQLSSQFKDLRKLFFQYRSNARILQKSPYYNSSKEKRKKLIEMISTRRYDVTGQLQKQINEKYGWDQSDENQKKESAKKIIKVSLYYDNRVYQLNIQCATCKQLETKLTADLAKIMVSLKNTYKKCDYLISFQTIEANHQIDFILSNPSLNITFLNHLHLKPVFCLEQRLLISRGLNTKITIKDFKFIKCLGNGGFSSVYLVKGNLDGKFYAMKLIDKQFIIDSQRDGIVQNQRYILGQLHSPFVTQLQFAFQTKNHFVLVIQYCPGGELFYQLKKVKRMKQQEAKFYFLQILIGLDYIHQKNIVYRDLKPQNLLIGIDGHIKIADFGLSKPIDDKRQNSYSFCGSPEYMAPQMLMKTGHNYLLDYYCLGALLYQLVIGVPPYYSLDHQQIYNSILNQQLSFPNYVQISQELKSLLRGLLNKNTKKRLGCMFGLKEILLHPWIGKLKQKSIQNKQLLPPFIPNLQAFNFDINDIKTDQEAVHKKIEDDILNIEFQTHFNDQFNYQNKDFKEKLQNVVKKIENDRKELKYMRKSKSLQNKIGFQNRKKNGEKKGEKFHQQSNGNLTSRVLKKVKSSKLFGWTYRA